MNRKLLFVALLCASIAPNANAQTSTIAPIIIRDDTTKVPRNSWVYEAIRRLRIVKIKNLKLIDEVPDTELTHRELAARVAQMLEKIVTFSKPAAQNNGTTPIRLSIKTIYRGEISSPDVRDVSGLEIDPLSEISRAEIEDLLKALMGEFKLELKQLGIAEVVLQPSETKPMFLRRSTPMILWRSTVK